MSSQQACAKEHHGPRCTNEVLRCTNEVLHHGDMCELHGGLHAQADKAKLIEHKRHNLVAFTNANQFDQPPRFFFGSCMGKRDYLPLLYRCWFKADDIATFEPGERFITGKKLLEHWKKQRAIPAAKRIKIACEESRLNPVHPTLGLSNKARPGYAKLKDGLFSLAEVKASEREEFDAPAAKEESKADAKKSNKRPLPQQQFQEQEILRVILSLSHDPKKLPKREDNKPGIKAEVRQALTFSPKVFDKAWERLRANQDIQDAE
jgi:hypothetical protein